MKPLTKQIVCNDGFSISVQASSTHYSLPRADFPEVPYTHVECGFPSAHPGDELVEYQEGCFGNDPTADVYPDVPIEIVERVVAAHGGIMTVAWPAYEDKDGLTSQADYIEMNW
jgi:hypothetical protein